MTADRRGRRSRYREAVAGVTRGAAVPYGYTLTTWASAASIAHLHDVPGPLVAGGANGLAMADQVLIGVGWIVLGALAPDVGHAQRG
jgi:hypothetical protein